MQICMYGHDLYLVVEGGCIVPPPSLHAALGISSLFMAKLPIILSLCDIVLFFHGHVLLYRMGWCERSLFRASILFVCLFVYNTE